MASFRAFLQGKGCRKVENSRTLLIKYISDAPIAQMDRASDYELNSDYPYQFLYFGKSLKVITF
jgi:hypothetical protein